MNNKRINVLYVIWSLALGGAERVVINLAKGLDKRRFNPIICCLYDKGEFAQELEQEGIEVIALHKKGKFDLSIIVKLTNLIKKRKVDIVHTHLWGANFWGRLAAQRANVKVVIATEHNVDIWKNWAYFMFDRLLSRRTDRIIAVSESVKEFYVAKGIAPEKIEVIYNGVTTSTEHQDSTIRIKEEFGIKDEEKVLAVIGRLVPQKGHRYFLLAMKELIKKYKVRGLVVGSGSLENELKVLNHNLGLNGNVIFTGLRKDIPRLLKILDVLVMPSLREGFPITALEAMAAGVPVVAAKVGGVPELVIDGETGFLVEPQDHAALKQAISRILNDNNLSRKLAENARQKIQKEFTINIMFSKTQELYEELFNQRQDNL